MKKISFFKAWTVIFIGPALSVSAQPVLTNLNFPPLPGEYYVVNRALPPASATMTAFGANHTWDFSNVTVLQGGIIYGNFDPVMTQFGPLYPAATVTCQSPVYPNTLIYLQDNINELVELGYNGMVWNNPRTVMEYPFTYADVFTDTGSYSAGSSYWIWHVNGMADGYGTLILPYGTVTNVLRVSEQVNRYTGQGWVPEYSYSWYQPGTRTPICKYWTDMLDDIFTIGNHLLQG